MHEPVFVQLVLSPKRTSAVPVVEAVQYHPTRVTASGGFQSRSEVVPTEKLLPMASRVDEAILNDLEEVADKAKEPPLANWSCWAVESTQSEAKPEVALAGQVATRGR